MLTEFVPFYGILFVVPFYGILFVVPFYGILFVVPFYGILFKMISFEINGEGLIWCESYCIAWNREYSE